MIGGKVNSELRRNVAESKNVLLLRWFLYYALVTTTVNFTALTLLRVWNENSCVLIHQWLK